MRGRQKPRAPEIVDDSDDLVIVHFETDHRFRRPDRIDRTQTDNHRYSVDIPQYHSPRQIHFLVLNEIRRIRKPSGKPICEEQARIRADKFADAIPVVPVESIDVEPQYFHAFRIAVLRSWRLR